MTVEISYFARIATGGVPMAADPGQDGTSAEAESVTISATPALSGATPDGQTALSLAGTEAFRFEYSPAGAIAAVANSNYVAAGERLWAGVTTILFWKIRRVAALLMLPYLAWLLFAGYLNWQIHLLNPWGPALVPTAGDTQIIIQ